MKYKIGWGIGEKKGMVNAEENKRGKEEPTPPLSNRETKCNGRVGAAGLPIARKTPLSTDAHSTPSFLTLPPPGFQGTVFFDSPTLHTRLLSISATLGLSP